MQTKPTFLNDFYGDILVRCPRCSGRAHLLELDRTDGRHNGHRLVCSACAFEHDSVWVTDDRVSLAANGPRQSGSRIDLWLVTESCGEKLWAYNREHLDFLAGHVGAKIRPRARDPKYGWSSRCLESCLPKWMLSRHNRDDVLRGIERLRDELEDGARPDRI